MIYLFLNILFAVSFNQWLRYGQRRGAHVNAVGSVNYIIAAAACAAYLARTGLAGGAAEARGAAALGGLVGAMFFVAFLALVVAYRAAGVGIAVAFMGSAAVVPSIVSWLVWGEPMTVMRWAAVALLPGAIVLMRPPVAVDRRATLRGNAAVLATFALSGAAQTMHKASALYFPDSRPAYLTGLFVVAAVMTTANTLRERRPWGLRDVAIGTAVGLSNALSVGTQLLCLSIMPAVIYFPTMGPALICLNLIVARVLWDERLVRRQAGGIALAVAVVVLTNLG